MTEYTRRPIRVMHMAELGAPRSVCGLIRTRFLLGRRVSKKVRFCKRCARPGHCAWYVIDADRRVVGLSGAFNATSSTVNTVVMKWWTR